MNFFFIMSIINFDGNEKLKREDSKKKCKAN